MKRLVNNTLRLYLKSRYKKIEHSVNDPLVTQNDILEGLLYMASDTEIGKKYKFQTISGYQSFRNRVPVSEYDDIKRDITRMMGGEVDVLWPGYTKWYAKSSGTTSDKSKFIPVSKQNLRDCHIKGSWDTVAILYHNLPEAKIFEYKNLIIGGTLYDYSMYPETKFGDVSAILIHHMPFVGRPFYIPDFKTAFMKKWEEKLERIAHVAAFDSEISSIGGVPTWNIVLFRRILEITQKEHLLEVWPNLKVYAHGGVNFEPYREQFKKLIPSKDFIYQETYNASEGYFATQNDYRSNDLLLLLDNGIFYEFIPLDDYEHDHARAIPLTEIEPGVNYVMIISTNSGLWRYVPGDTVMFTSTKPYKLKITGRTKHFINAFGEEVMVSNTDKAISLVSEETGIKISDYTVAPVYLDGGGKGCHEWLIEFEKEPADLDSYSQRLDVALQNINSDYEAKRYQDLALTCLKIIPVPKGTFLRWLKKKGKLGSQAKLPRLSNHRNIVEDILTMIPDATSV